MNTRARFNLRIVCRGKALFFSLDYLSRIDEPWALSTNIGLLLEFFKSLLVLFALILFRSFSVAVSPLALFLVASAALFVSLAFLASAGTALLFVSTVTTTVIILLLSLLLVLFVFLLSAFLLGIVFLGFLVTIADKEVLWFLKVNDVSATIKEMCLVDHIVEPELNGFFFILDCQKDTVSIKLLSWMMCLTPKVYDIIIHEGTGYILIEFLVSKSAQSRRFRGFITI